MSMTDKGGWIKRLMAGDVTMCLFCVGCCIKPMYLACTTHVFQVNDLMYLGTMGSRDV